MIKAFVLIVVDPAETQRVYSALQAVDGISEVYQVMGALRPRCRDRCPKHHPGPVPNQPTHSCR